MLGGQRGRGGRGRAPGGLCSWAMAGASKCRSVQPGWREGSGSSCPNARSPPHMHAPPSSPQARSPPQPRGSSPSCNPPISPSNSSRPPSPPKGHFVSALCRKSAPLLPLPLSGSLGHPAISQPLPWRPGDLLGVDLFLLSVASHPQFKQKEMKSSQSSLFGGQVGMVLGGSLSQDPSLSGCRCCRWRGRAPASPQPLFQAFLADCEHSSLQPRTCRRPVLP